jgi:hypothetical protein
MAERNLHAPGDATSDRAPSRLTAGERAAMLM